MRRAPRAPPILTLGGRARPTVLEQLPYSLQTGKTGMEKAFGKPLFDYLAERPREASLFSETMVGFHGPSHPQWPPAYDFGASQEHRRCRRRNGQYARATPVAADGPRGVLFDLPHVVTHAPAFLASHGVADRVTIQGGSFFERVPAGHDAYLLSPHHPRLGRREVPTILSHCRSAMDPKAGS